MVRGLKAQDRVKGNRADLRNLNGVILEVIPQLGPNTFRVRWDNGQFGTYLARNLQKIVLGPVGGANNLGPGGALADLEAAVPPQGGHQHDMIAGNEEYDDSDQESNYGSR
jgi:hypothetical protein